MNLRYPERLLQPWKDLRQFTQELYAMVRSGNEDVSGGIDVDTPPVKVGEQSFKVQRKASGELNLVPEAQARHKRDEPSEGPRTFEAPPRRRREPEGRTRREPAIEERLRQAIRGPEPPDGGRSVAPASLTRRPIGGRTSRPRPRSLAGRGGSGSPSRPRRRAGDARPPIRPRRSRTGRLKPPTRRAGTSS
jgi:hypothetical protein